MDKTALVPTIQRSAQPHPLARYGDARVVRALADRIELTDTGKIPMNENERLYLAQSSIAYGLDPFLHEIWGWPVIKNGRRRFTIMRGRDGSLKLANANAMAAGTHLLAPRFRLITDTSERQRLLIPDEALAFEAKIEDHLSNTQWQSMVNTLKDIGSTKEEIFEKVGDSPASIGLGVMTLSEMKVLDRTPNKMTHVERAKKRALTAALRVRWQAGIPDQDFVAPNSTDAYIIEGEWTEVESLSPEEVAAKAKTATHDLFESDGSKNSDIDQNPDEPTAADILKQTRDLAREQPEKIGAPQFWMIANNFGISNDEGYGIKKGVKTWAAALIYVIDKYGELDGLEPDSPIDATDTAIELAAKHAINLRAVPGTGKGGRIVLKDVEQVIREGVK